MTSLFVPHDQVFIGGDWRAPRSGSTFPDLDPGTGEIITGIARASASDVDAAVSAARNAFAAWSRCSPVERATLMRRWATLIREHSDDLAALEARDVGKPLSAGKLNIAVAAGNLEYAAGLADKALGATLPATSTDHTGLTWREPWGVCALVLAWNVPAIMLCGGVGPAIAAGNTTVVKPSELAPLVSQALVGLASDAGIPPGVINLVTGLGQEAGVALTSHAGVNHISFVGSTVTGRAVMKSAAENLVPVRLELGGKSPNVVFADADLEHALPIILESITENAGQNCYAGSRLLVEEPIYDEVVGRLAEMSTKVRIGLWNEDLDMGPLISEAQYEKVLSYIDSGVSEGARLVTGGAIDEDRLRSGWFVKPTVFDHVQPSMRVASEEVFGPVLAAQSFRTTSEAVDLVDTNPYGLLVAIWTNDLSRALRVARQVSSGQVSINEFANTSIIGLPFNVAKHSGFNHGAGYAVMNEFTREKAVTIQLLDR
jgi:aldehyde dehydrogenase (NAD+)